MSDYNNDDIDEDVEENEPAGGTGAAGGGNNRNFILALGIMGAVFILILIVLAILYFSRPRGGTTANVNPIALTNEVIMTANAGTALAATNSASLLLTPSATPIPPTATQTSVPPTATITSVVVLATATQGLTALPGGAITLTPILQTRTATLVALATQNAQQTQTQVAKVQLTGTATNLPKTGFAEDVGLPGLFGMALGLILLIVIVRRLRLSPGK